MALLKIKRVGGKTQVYDGVTYYEHDDEFLQLETKSGNIVSVDMENILRVFIVGENGKTIDQIVGTAVVFASEDVPAIEDK